MNRRASMPLARWALRRRRLSERQLSAIGEGHSVAISYEAYARILNNVMHEAPEITRSEIFKPTPFKKMMKRG